MTIFIMFCQNDSTHINQNKTEIFLLNEILIQVDLESLNSRKDYLLLKYRVLKVYPYIDSIKNIIVLADTDLEDFSKKRLSRRYIRKLQKKLINHFREDITNLTRKEGVVLSKLIYREFNMTAYDIIGDYRGGFHAFWWQQISKIYDGNLKSTFDPDQNKEDMLIEYIVQQYIIE